MSNLVTMVTGEAPTTPQREAPKAADLLLVTSAGGMQFRIDRRSKTFTQTRVSSGLEGIASPNIYGTYWTLKPDPPVNGQDCRIWGPRPNDERPRIIDLYEVSIEVLDADAG